MLIWNWCSTTWNEKQMPLHYLDEKAFCFTMKAVSMKYWVLCWIREERKKVCCMYCMPTGLQHRKRSIQNGIQYNLTWAYKSNSPCPCCNNKGTETDRLSLNDQKTCHSMGEHIAFSGWVVLTHIVCHEPSITFERNWKWLAVLPENKKQTHCDLHPPPLIPLGSSQRYC